MLCFTVHSTLNLDLHVALDFESSILSNIFSCQTCRDVKVSALYGLDLYIETHPVSSTNLELSYCWHLAAGTCGIFFISALGFSTFSSCAGDVHYCMYCNTLLTLYSSLEFEGGLVDDLLCVILLFSVPSTWYTTGASIGVLIFGMICLPTVGILML